MDSLLMKSLNNMGGLKEECRICGGRHRSYFKSGADVAYWDSFCVSFVESLEKEFPEESVPFSHDTDSWHVIDAWYRLINIIVSEMRLGFLQEEKRRKFKMS